MRTWSTLRIILVIAGVLITAAQAAIAQTNVDFLPNGPADWNTNTNWAPPFVPEASVNEIAVLGSGKSAFVDDTPANVGGITINSGILDVRSGGNLSAVAGSIVPGNLTVSGTGALTVRRGGTLSVQGLTAANTSTIIVGEVDSTGTASFKTTGGTLAGTTRAVGASSSFMSTGPLAFSNTSVVIPVITSVSHAPISATAAVSAGGSIRPQFNGYTPVLGDSWNIVSGSSVTGRFTLDKSLAPVAPRGVDLSLAQTATTTSLRYTNKLILQVNRGTGAATVHNVIGNPIAFDGYTVSSATGVLDGTWNSLDDQALTTWEEADNTSAFRLTEFNPRGTATVATGASLNLGTPFSPPAPSAFGDAVGEDLRFQYTLPAAGAAPAQTVDGIIEYVGGHNNLVLTINPANGQAAIQNESPYFDVAIEAYTISSANGRLRFANGQWNSLDDQNLGTWEQADNVNANRVTEFNPSGATALPGGGTILNLGALVDVTSSVLRTDEFTFQFSLVGGGTPGDYNENGIVDAADYVVWRNSLGSATSLPNDDSVGVGQDDYARWRQNFGNSAGSGVGETLQGVVVLGALPAGSSLAAGTSVPEPGTFAGTVVLLALLTVVRRGNRRAEGGA